MREPRFLAKYNAEAPVKWHAILLTGSFVVLFITGIIAGALIPGGFIGGALIGTAVGLILGNMYRFDWMTYWDKYPERFKG